MQTIRQKAHVRAAAAATRITTTTTPQSSGVARLDALLGGGIPAGGTFLVLGPAFSGKGTLQTLAVAAALKDERPVVFVTLRRPVERCQAALRDLVPDLDAKGASGAIRYVDACSRGIGSKTVVPHTRYVDEPTDLDAFAAALDASLHDLEDAALAPLVVLDTVTPLLTLCGAPETFRFLDRLVGRARMQGAITHLSAQSDAHSEERLALLRYLADHVLTLRLEQGGNVLRLDGNDLRQSLGWIEYEHGRDAFAITGSFSATRIR